MKNQIPTTNKKKNKSKTSESGGIPTFKEFLFSTGMLDYSTLMKQEGQGSSRTLIKYYTSVNNPDLHKYLLVHTNEDKSWSYMYIVSKGLIARDFDLYKIDILDDEVINFNSFREHGNYIAINGVKIKDKIYSLEEPITAENGRVPAKCEETDYCIDSWLITYGEESGTIYWVEYSPICYTVHCNSGGGSTNPATPPTTCDPNAHYPEEQEFNHYVQKQSIPALIESPTTEPSSGPATGSFTWTVAEGMSWRIDAVTDYAYYHERYYNLITNTIEHVFDITSFNTSDGFFVGSNTFINSEYTNQKTINKIINNNTADAKGTTHIVGILKHVMNTPVRVPYCGPLHLQFTDEIDNRLNFLPR